MKSSLTRTADSPLERALGILAAWLVEVVLSLEAAKDKIRTRRLVRQWCAPTKGGHRA